MQFVSPQFPDYQINFCEITHLTVYDPFLDEILDARRVLVCAPNEGENTGDHYYWIKSKLMDSKCGMVRIAVKLKRQLEPVSRWEVTSERYVIKQSYKNRIILGSAENPLQEIKALQFMRDALLSGMPRTPELQNSLSQRNHLLLPTHLCQDQGSYFVVMPYCHGGDLFSHLDLTRQNSEAETRFWIRQVLQGLKSLHAMKLAHCDMSLENVVIQNESCFIMDFGQTRLVPFENNMPQLIRPHGPLGKKIYMCPEIYRLEEFDGFKADLWSVGVMLYIMVFGDSPWDFPHETDDGFLYISTGGLSDVLEVRGLGDAVSTEVVDLLQGMLRYMPSKRFSLEDVLSHPWMQGDTQGPNQVTG